MGGLNSIVKLSRGYFVNYFLLSLVESLAGLPALWFSLSPSPLFIDPPNGRLAQTSSLRYLTQGIALFKKRDDIRVFGGRRSFHGDRV